MFCAMPRPVNVCLLSSIYKGFDHTLRSAICQPAWVFAQSRFDKVHITHSQLWMTHDFVLCENVGGSRSAINGGVESSYAKVGRAFDVQYGSCATKRVL